MNKSIASTHGQKNNGYSAFTEYPLSRLPTPSDRCHNRNFWNYFLMSTRPSRDAVLRIIADERMVVKFEQNNCYCSVRGDKVVFGQAASTRPVAHRWLPFHAARAPTLARAVFSASNTEHRHLWNKISPAATETPTRMDRCFYAL